MTEYREKDAAKDTRAPEREVNAAWHHARDQTDVRTGGENDRPSARNRADAERIGERVMDRGRAREREERSAKTRDER